MIAEFGATLALTCKQRKDLKLITWLPESNDLQIETHIPEEQLFSEMKKWKNQKQPHGLTLKKKPDAIFGLQTNKGQAFFMFEADRGTETRNRFLQKMVTYYYFLSQDKFKEWSQKLTIQPQAKPIKKFRVITYAQNPDRQKLLIKAGLEVNPEKEGSAMFWFTNQTLLNPEKPETIFNNIFSIAEIDELNQLHSILE